MTAPLRNIPIRRKLIIVTVLTAGGVMLATLIAFFTYDLMKYRRALEQQVSVIARIIADNSTASLAFSDPADAAQILSALRAERYIEGAALYDPSGVLFARYPADGSLSRLPTTAGASGFQFEGGFLHGFEPVMQGNKRLGTLYLQLNSNAMLKSWIVGVLALSGSIAVAGLALAYVVSRAVQQRISGPILELATTARAVSDRRDFSVRAKKHGDDEIGALTDAFNQMLAEIQQRHRDIGELNQALERRVTERTLQLEAANKELEAFSYSVSHDLRAPLRHIDGFAQLLKNRLNGALDPTAERFFSNIVNSARSMGTLIDELLAFSRMGRTELSAVEVDLNVLVQETVRETKPDCADREIDWRIAPLPVVRADPGMLRQVWRNLISNAIKYSRGRAPAVITIDHQLGDDEHIFSVRDNGAGFDMQYVHKLFGVFQRLHTTGEFEGTGIGLANVRRIVARHGGRTWAEGALNAGAAFYFTLPASTPMRAP